MEPEQQARLEFLRGRRSIRVYAPGEVTDEMIQAILEGAMSAPSAVAKDPWRFVVIRNRETLKQLAAKLPNGQMLVTAEVGIVVCGDITAAHDRQLSYMLQDCAACVQNLLLAVHALDLGACWLGVHPREDRVAHIKQALGLPQSVIPVCAVAVGHPGERKEPRTRFSGAFVHYEKW